MTAASADGTTLRRGAGRQPIRRAAERITVALVPKAGAELQRLQERTGSSKTDLTNRAIPIYYFIDAQLRQGQDVLIQDSRSAETRLNGGAPEWYGREEHGRPTAENERAGGS